MEPWMALMVSKNGKRSAMSQTNNAASTESKQCQIHQRQVMWTIVHGTSSGQGCLMHSQCSKLRTDAKISSMTMRQEHKRSSLYGVQLQNKGGILSLHGAVYMHTHRKPHTRGDGQGTRGGGWEGGEGVLFRQLQQFHGEK